MTLEQTQYAIKCSLKVIHIQQKVSKHVSNQNDEKGYDFYNDELMNKKNELDNLKEELAKIIHSQHISNPQTSTQYGNKIQNILTDIHAHFSQELALQSELLNERHKEFLLSNEASIKEYEVFKIQHDSDNIVNKEKGLTLKIKDYTKDISKINEKLIHTKARIQDKYQTLSDFKNRREELENKISIVLNEPLGSSLNVAYKSYILAHDKYEKELNNKFGSFEVKKHDWEIYKLISQIKIRDKTIENMLLELSKLDVKNIDVTKEKDSLRLIQDYRIDQNAIFQFSNNSGKINYQPVNELLNSIDSRSNKPKMVSFKSSNSSINNNKKYEDNNNDSVNSSFKNHPNSVKSNHIKFNPSDTNSNNPYMVNVPLKKDYNRNNKLSVNHVKEVTPNMYDYSDYKNPFINKKKIKFNTKTTKVIEASLRGGLNEVKMRVLDSLYPNSKVDFLYDNNKRSTNLNVSKDRSIIKDNKMNATSHSNRSNSDSKHNSIMNKSQGSFESFEERKIDRKVKKLFPNKNIIGRYHNNPYVSSKK